MNQTFELPEGSVADAKVIPLEACAYKDESVFEPHPNMGGRVYIPNHVVICSIFPDYLDHKMKHGGGIKTYSMQPVPKGQYGLLFVYDTFTVTRNFSMDSDDEYMNSPVPCEGIAQDLVRRWAHDAPGNRSGASPGIQILAGIKPTELELKQMVDNQTTYFRFLVAKADEYFYNNKREFITRDHRRALRWLNTEDREWYRDIESVIYKDCPACGEKINENAVVCKTCHTNLVEFYKENGIRITPDLDRAVFSFYQRTIANIGKKSPAAV